MRCRARPVLPASRASSLRARLRRRVRARRTVRSSRCRRALTHCQATSWRCTASSSSFHKPIQHGFLLAVRQPLAQRGIQSVTPCITYLLSVWSRPASAVSVRSALQWQPAPSGCLSFP